MNIVLTGSLGNIGKPLRAVTSQLYKCATQGTIHKASAVVLIIFFFCIVAGYCAVFDAVCVNTRVMQFSYKKAGFNDAKALDTIDKKALPLRVMQDIEPLIERLGTQRIVMLGEASHGTHEYYTYRSYISKRLVEQYGFDFIAVEGDWPDCFRINQFVKSGSAEQAVHILQQFNRWPTWMWANWEVAALMEWMQRHNGGGKKKVGFFGLDVYSLWESLNAIMEYLQKVDPAALKKAQEAFTCFEPYKKDEGSSYAMASRLVPEICEDEVVALLKEVQQKLPTYDSGVENVFNAEQNALIAVNAEKYYRAMVKGDAQSWNVRDEHMMQTLQRLLEFHGSDSKAIVWAHNTHIGDASATDMTDDGMYNIGELARAAFDNVALVGFGSYKGSVIAGSSWGADMQVMDVPEAREGSWEQLLHDAKPGNKLLLKEHLDEDMFMQNRIGHRAIGVVYRPAYERYGNYVATIIPKRYDAFIYIDQTKALHPLHVTTDTAQMPETYPFGV